MAVCRPWARRLPACRRSRTQARCARCSTPRGRGRILAVDAGCALRVAVLGERMARLGLANGWRGVIVHGAVRDAAALAGLDFAVLALGAVPRRAQPAAPALARYGALALGGVEVADGDWAGLDADGLVFVRAPGQRT